MIQIGLIALCVIFLIISLLKEKELRNYKKTTDDLISDIEDEVFIVENEYEQLKIKYERLQKTSPD